MPIAQVVLGMSGGAAARAGETCAAHPSTRDSPSGAAPRTASSRRARSRARSDRDSTSADWPDCASGTRATAPRPCRPCPSARPGWPELACWTASMASTRMTLASSRRVGMWGFSRSGIGEAKGARIVYGRAIQSDNAPGQPHAILAFPPATPLPGIRVANSFLFTSESVSEGHPGQGRRPDFGRGARCDPGGRPGRSRGLRDAGQDRRGHRGGRSDHLGVDRPGKTGARDRARDRLRQLGDGLRRRELRRGQHHRQAIARHRHGRGPQEQAQAGRRRPGIDVRLRHQRNRRADARADHPRPPPRQAPGRRAQARQARLAAPRRQEPDHAALRTRSSGGHRSGGALHAAQPGSLHEEAARSGHGRDHQAGAAEALAQASARSTTSTRPGASWSADRWAIAA